MQGAIAFKKVPQNKAVQVDIVESAPFNNRHILGNKEKEYDGVGGHLFAETVKYSYAYGYDGAVYFTAKSDLVEHYTEKLGAVLINPRQRTMFIDEQSARILYDKYYGKKNK